MSIAYDLLTRLSDSLENRDIPAHEVQQRIDMIQNILRREHFKDFWFKIGVSFALIGVGALIGSYVTIHLLVV